MKFFTALVIVITIAACRADGPAFVDDTGMPSTFDDDITDNMGDGTTDEPIDASYLSDEWVYAPEGLCDDPSRHAYIKNVKDGDTVELTFAVDGFTTVRYIGVDAPETYKSECWSHEAEVELARLTPTNIPVCLINDSQSSNVDKYGRLLRYVFAHNGVGWGMQNARLVRLGAAKAYHEFLSGKDYRWEIKDAEKAAILEEQGGWGNCSDWGLLNGG